MQGIIGGRRRLPYAIRTGLCFDLVLVSLSLTQETNPINHVIEHSTSDINGPGT